jgi:hypothetical protein
MVLFDHSRGNKDLESSFFMQKELFANSGKWQNLRLFFSVLA